MKKNILFVLMACLTLSCHQDNNELQSSDIKNDNNTMQLEKVPKLDIDALYASPANFKLLLENQYVRVLEYTVDPGKKDEWHTHPAKSSYVASGGQIKVYLENGEVIIADEKTGTVSWMNAVGKHYVENVGKTTVKIILTEIKSL